MASNITKVNSDEAEMEEKDEVLDSVVIEVKKNKISNPMKPSLKKRASAYFQSRPFLFLLKHTIATLVGLLFTLINPVKDHLGPTNTLVAVTIVLMDLSRSVGGMIQSTIELGIGIVFTAAATIFSVYICFLNPYGLLVMLFVFTFIFTYIRGISAEWSFSMLIGKIILCFGIITSFRGRELGVDGSFDATVDYIFRLSENIMIGATIATICNALIFPWSSSADLQMEIVAALRNARNVLQLSTKAFKSGLSDEERQKLNVLEIAMKKNFSKVASLNTEIKLHPTFGYFSPARFAVLTKTLRKMLQYLTAMESSNITEEMLGDENVTTLTNQLHGIIESVSKSSSQLMIIAERLCEKRDKSTFETFQTSVSEIEELSKRYQTIENDLVDSLYQRAKEEKIPSYDWIFRMYYYCFILNEFLKELLLFSHLLGEEKIRRKIHLPTRPFGVKSFKRIWCGKKSNQGKLTIKERIWKLSEFFTTNEVHFALKVSFAVILTAIPAFVESSTGWYKYWRGEWTIITVFVVISPTFASSAQISLYRLLGTIFGAVFGLASWLILDGNPYVLAATTAVTSVISFYMKYSTGFSRVGVVTITTFLVIILGEYNLVEKTWTIYELSYIRGVTNSLGILIAVIISRVVWPYLARKELREVLASSISVFGQQFTKLVRAFHQTKLKPDEIALFEKTELKLQMSIFRCFDLLIQGKQEPRLKGPFPLRPYQEILSSLQFILDRFVSIRLALSYGIDDEVREHMIIPLSSQRKDMTKNIMLCFYIYSGALRSRDPLPYYLPEASKQREKLITALRQLPGIKNGSLKSRSVINYYAYGLSMKDIIEEIEAIGRSMKVLFGEDSDLEGVFEPLEKLKNPENRQPRPTSFRSLITFSIEH